MWNTITYCVVAMSGTQGLKHHGLAIQLRGGPIRTQPCWSRLHQQVWYAESQQSRHLLTCCVRLSPEKEPERFVALAEELQRQGSLSRLGLRPILCGSARGVASRTLDCMCFCMT